MLYSNAMNYPKIELKGKTWKGNIEIEMQYIYPMSQRNSMVPLEPEIF